MSDHDDLSGELGTVTDDEWRVAHEQLIADNPNLTGTDYIWDLDLDPAQLINPHEREIAPAHGDWHDGMGDERFTGGGFRG